MKRILFSIAALLLLGHAALAQQQAFVVRNVTVIPMTAQKTLPNHDVFIRKGRIEKIQKSKTGAGAAGYTVIDGKGKYLMPGLFDMHAHFLYEQGMPMAHAVNELNLMLANGVTTVRIMNGGDVYKRFLSEHPKSSYTSFPDVVLVSPQFVGEWPWKRDTLSPKELVQTPAEAAAAVTKYKQQGYPAIKVAQFVKADQYQAIVTQARKEGIAVVGHVGPWVKLPAALAAGQQIEHLDEFVEMLLPDSLRNKGMVSVSDVHIWKAEHWPSVDLLDEKRIPVLVKAVKDARINVTPTNYFFAANFAKGQSEEEIRSRPDYPFIPEQLLEERAGTRQHWTNKNIDAARRARWIGLRNKIIY